MSYVDILGVEPPSPILGQYRRVLNYVWDVDGLFWIPEQQPIIEGTITGLTVNQGTAGSDPWSVEFLTPQAVTGPVTDTELRAADVKITLDGESVAVTGPLTDTQLRATPVPVSGTITAITNPVSTKTDLTPSAPTFATVGVASAQVIAANANRKGLVLINTSSNRISLGFGSAAVLDSGITLYPMGVFEMDEYLFDIGAVNAIASVASSNLTIQEYTT